MSSFTTESLVIKRINVGEADRIISLLTPFRGKILVLAKGVRRITSRRGGNIELLNQVRVHLYEARNLPILTEAESIKTFSKLKENLTLTTYATHLLEITDKLLPENVIQPEVYRLLLTTLNFLESSPRRIFVRAYEVKLLSILGFWSKNQISTSEDIKKLLEILETKTYQEISHFTLTESESLELERILRYYLEQVIESSLKSIEMISKRRKDE